MKVTIDYNDGKEIISVIPDDFKLSRLRGLSSYIRVLNGEVVSDQLAEIPLKNAEVNDVYNKIKRIFEDEFDCEIETNISAQNKFSEAEEEAKRFAVFSAKAERIRNNEISTEEFSDFCSVIGTIDFKRNLKPYQLLAAYHIAFSLNACNFSVPGSGKTTTVLAAYEYLKKNNTVDKLVVIGPLSAFIAWKLEYKECFGHMPICQEIRGGINKKIIAQELMVSNTNVELLIISYGSVCSNREVITFFLDNNRCMVVLDEAHRIKKVAEDAQSNYVLSLAPLAKSRVVLTGTPAANSYIDLFNLYKFIWPFNNIIGYSVAQLSAMSKDSDDSRRLDLIKRISPFFIRVRKSELGLPDAVFEDPYCIEMSCVQKEIYNAIERIVINKYETNGLPEGIRKAATIRLRQASSNPGLLLKAIENDYDAYETDVPASSNTDDIELDDNLINKIIKYKQLEVPNKFEKALEIVRDLVRQGEKAIVWCEFIGTCEDLSGYFEKNGIENRILYGKCNQEDRELIIEEFLGNESSFDVIVANPHAVGESISLHTACHNAIYLEQGFNAGVYMQSKDRIHRVGLREDEITRYYYIQSADSVDHVVYERVLEKESRMLELIESEEIPLLSNIDYEENSDADIRAIIKDYYDRRNRLI